MGAVEDTLVLYCAMIKAGTAAGSEGGFVPFFAGLFFERGELTHAAVISIGTGSSERKVTLASCAKHGYELATLD